MRIILTLLVGSLPGLMQVDCNWYNPAALGGYNSQSQAIDNSLSFFLWGRTPLLGHTTSRTQYLIIKCGGPLVSLHQDTNLCASLHRLRAEPDIKSQQSTLLNLSPSNFPGTSHMPPGSGVSGAVPPLAREFWDWWHMNIILFVNELICWNFVLGDIQMPQICLMYIFMCMLTLCNI